MANTIIKITQLPSIGNGLTTNTVLPVVDVNGTATTAKVTVGSIANFALMQAGDLLPPAFVSQISYSVANAAQPNITSLGTLTSLTSSGNVTANYFIGDGSLLTNIPASSSYGDSNVANFLPTYSGNLGVGALINSAGNIDVAPGANTGWVFTIGGALKWPGGNTNHIIGENPDREFEIRSDNNVVISTDLVNSNLHFTFDSTGVFTSPGNVNLLGTRLNIGAESPNISLTGPTIVIGDGSPTFIQTAQFNTNPNGSSDFVAYGSNADELGGWADLGFAGYSFNDPLYTITNPGDGYVFSLGYTNGVGGSLVLATGHNGNTRDIIFATGGFISTNEFGRISDANNSLELSKAGATITFPDNTIQSTAFIGNISAANVTGLGNVALLNLDGNASNVLTGNGAFATLPVINSNTVVWTTAPVANNSAGTAGQASYDAGGNLFVCVDTNTWSKITGTTSW